MMSKEELSQDVDSLDDDKKLEFYEHVLDDMVHDRNLRIDADDYEADLEDYWAMNELHHNHFQLFFTFYGLLALFLSYTDYKAMSELTLTNVLFFEGGVTLLVLAYMIFHHESRHDKDYKAYVKARLSAFNKAKKAI